MEGYEYIKRKYSYKLDKDTNFEKFLEKTLDDYFKEKSIIDELFDLRNEESRLVSDKEVEIMSKDELIYEKLILLCGREKELEIDEIISLIEENKQDLVELYSKEFYKLGIKDARAFKKLL